MTERQDARSDEVVRGSLLRRLWHARWLWVVFLAGGLVLVFLLRGGDLATFGPVGEADGPGREGGAAPSEQQAEAPESVSETGRHLSRQVRQRDSGPEALEQRTSRSTSAREHEPTPVTLDAAHFETEHRSVRTSRSGNGGDESDDDSELTIGGTVLDAAGVPLPDIRIEANAMSAYLPDPGSVVTDALGMFSFQSLESGEYVLTVPESDDHHSASVQVRAGSASVEIYLRPRGRVTVHGLVQDEAGQPLDLARVRLLGGDETRTGADGSYRVTGSWPRAGQAPVVEFRHPDYLVKRQALASSSAGSSSEIRLDVQLEPREASAVLAGRLTGPAGESISDARIWLSSSSPSVHRQAVTDAAGYFLLERLEPGGHFLLGVSPPEGYASWVSEPMAISAGNNRRDIELQRDDRGGLFGAVIDPDGRPLGNFAMWARSTTPAGQSAIPVVTDSAGQFWLPDIAAGVMQLETRSLPRLEARGIQIEAGRDNQAVVPMDWGEQWLFGTVLDERGSPVAGATVSLQWGEQFPDAYSTSVRQVRSDLDGQFVFSNLGADHYALVARADGHVTRRVQNVPVGPGAEEVQVVLEPAGGGAAGGGGK